jgi:hypothetical protein
MEQLPLWETQELADRAILLGSQSACIRRGVRAIRLLEADGEEVDVFEAREVWRG